MGECKIDRTDDSDYRIPVDVMRVVELLGNSEGAHPLYKQLEVFIERVVRSNDGA